MAKAPNLSFIKEAREELAKVSWPSRETTIRYTVIVIVMSLAVGAITGAMDYVLSKVFQYFIFS
jgi:preprotein translocase subunit SecE